MSDNSLSEAASGLGALLSPEDRRQQLIGLSWWVSIPHTFVPAHWLLRDDNRLDASYHSQDAVTAKRIINDSGYETKLLKNAVSNIFILGRFRRVYANAPKHGWPYLSASQAIGFRPTSDRWIARNHAPKKAKLHFAKRGWILVTSSGTTGRLALVMQRLEKYFLTHDLIRIVPKESPPVGYIYAFLSTWIGQSLITKDQYGAAIKHLEPHHIASVPVPLLPESEQKTIHEEIMRAYALREEANNLLDDANDLLYKALGLREFNENLAPYLPPPPRPRTNRPEIIHPHAFAVRASVLDERLDASYQVPVARTAIKLLHKSKYKPVQLASLVEEIDVAPRFKRIYVSKEYGVPFVQGSHLPQMQPYGLKYLSLKKQRNLERWIVRKGWVLVTCSGTIGRVALVPSNQDKWAASQHLLRIIPDYSKGHPGFLATFLMTPYGQHQLTAKIYGGVVDELTEDDTGAVWIPDAPTNIQTAIGEKAVNAFEKKAEAIEIENFAIGTVEMALQQS